VRRLIAYAPERALESLREAVLKTAARS